MRFLILYFLFFIFILPDFLSMPHLLKREMTSSGMGFNCKTITSDFFKCHTVYISNSAKKRSESNKHAVTDSF